MKLHDFTHILRHPEATGPGETEALDSIVAEFPYFQSARALRLKGLYNQDSFRYNFALKVTAAYTQDRSVLFDFISSETFTSINRKPENTTNGTHLTDTDFSKSDPVQDAITSDRDFETIESTDISTDGMALQEDETVLTEPIEDPVSQSIRSSIENAKSQPELAKVTQPVDAPQTAIPEKVTENVQTLEPADKLQAGKPLEFTAQEKHSFAEWLQLAGVKPIVREPEPEKKDAIPQVGPDAERLKKIEIIDRFIEANPKISPVKPSAASAPIVFEPSRAVDNSYLMTETLARVYLEQQKYDKAIQAYEILILKYPEKSSFFADRILDIRSLKKSNLKSE